MLHSVRSERYLSRRLPFTHLPILTGFMAIATIMGSGTLGAALAQPQSRSISGGQSDADFVFRSPEETAAANAQDASPTAPLVDPLPLSPDGTISPEVEYQFLKLASVLAAHADDAHLAELANYASTGPQPDGIDLDILAAAVDISADQIALQSTPEDVVAGGLYLLAVGHQSRERIDAKLDYLLQINPKLVAFDLNLLEEAVLLRWSILDALETIRARTQDPDIGAVVSRFNTDTLTLRGDYRLAVFSHELDALSAESLAELDYTLQAYTLGVNRDIDDRSATVAIRRANELNTQSKERAEQIFRARLQQILARRGTF